MDRKQYIVCANNPWWDFLNGYSCNSINESTFIGHLGWKFGHKCTQGMIFKAIEYGEITIEIYDPKSELNMVRKKPSVSNLKHRYSSDYGYTLEFEDGVIPQRMVFSNEVDADEWIKSQK